MNPAVGSQQSAVGRNLLSVVICCSLLSAFARAGETGKITQHLQDVSVTIRAGGTEGSGVLRTRDGINYVWTAGHVVRDLRSTREVVDPATGTKRTIVEFRDPTVVKQLVEDGRTVGKVEFDAEVLRYSDAANGHDLALLRIRKKNFASVSASFYLDPEIPAIGTDLYHVGSLLGQFGSNSLTTGVVSQIGRLHEKQTYDQTTVAAFPGSSGGGVFLRDGRYVGMLVRGAGETFNLMVPVRRMREWAKRAGVEWAIDDRVPVPSEQEMRKLHVEDVGATFEAGKLNEERNAERGASDEEFHFLIRPVRRQ